MNRCEWRHMPFFGNFASDKQEKAYSSLKDNYKAATWCKRLVTSELYLSHA